MNAVLRFNYPNINIDGLTNKKWAALYNEYIYVTNQKNENLESIIQLAILKADAKRGII